MAHDHSTTPAPAPPPAAQGHSAGHASTYTNVRPVVLFMVVLLIAGIIVEVCVAFLYGGLITLTTRNSQPGYFAAVQTRPPDPHLQVDPTADLVQLRRVEKEALTTYAWVDREHGIVRVPVDQAMEMYLKQQKEAATQPVEGRGR